MKYKILSHTADLRLEVYGKTVEMLFTNAADALADILVGKKTPLSYKKVPEERITIQSANLNTLLADFLNDILAKSHINKAIYKVTQISLGHSERSEESRRDPSSAGRRTQDDRGASLEVGLSGVKVDQFEEDVKAVTYHEVDIKKEKDLYRTRLVLDI